MQVKTTISGLDNLFAMVTEILPCTFRALRLLFASIVCTISSKKALELHDLREAPPEFSHENQGIDLGH